jgi:hypothetical protein
MTPNVVETHLVETPTAANSPLDHAEALATSLLSQRGEASGAAIARQLHNVLRKLSLEDRRKFQRFLATGFTPDAKLLRAAAEAYLSQPSAEAAASLAQAADPPRQELLRRMNMAAGGTSALVAMRKEITRGAGTAAARQRSEASVRVMVQPRLSATAPHRLAVSGRRARTADRL